MKFFKRLKYFAVGFSLGILFVYFLFKDRDFKWDWLPGNRVSNFILDHPIKIDESRLGEIIDKEDFSRSVYNAIIEGEVDFSNSKTNSELKTYIIENELDKLHILVSFTDSISKIIQFNDNIFFKENSIESNLINLNIDSTNFFKRINEKEIKLSKTFKCQLSEVEIKTEEFLNSFNSLKITWELSKPYKRPHPYFIGTIYINKKNYHILFEEGMDRIRIKKIGLFDQPLENNSIVKNLFINSCVKKY